MAFRFKQFSLEDSNSPMKLGTDAVLLGAWAKANSGDEILDIGSGSGIVSLMLVQRIPKAKICAVEINKLAFTDLVGNINNSRWKTRINPINSDFGSFQFLSFYNLIVSNPPFFDIDNSIISHGRKVARQKDTLTPQIICNRAKELLKDDSSLIVIYPYSSRNEFIKEALLCGLVLFEELKVRDNPNAEFKRSLLHFKNIKIKNVIIEELCIKDIEGQYSTEFKQLTKDFYL